jgi:hypothetical protein
MKNMTEDRNYLSEFQNNLKHLIGKECWSVIGGAGTGTHISLDFGDKIPIKKPLTNPHLTEEERNFNGEFSFYITCAWRIESELEVISGCWEDNAKDGPMLNGLQKIINQKVIAVELSLPALDLKLTFENNFSLQIFCDQTSLEEGYDNYTFFLRTREWFNVGTRSVLEKGYPEDYSLRDISGI